MSYLGSGAHASGFGWVLWLNCVKNEANSASAVSTGQLSALDAIARAPLQMSRLNPRQVSVISRRLAPISTSTAACDESAHRSSTTRLMQSRYWNNELQFACRTVSIGEVSEVS